MKNIVLLFLVTLSFSRPIKVVENNYEFVGEMTYSEVLSILSLNSNRSVLGSTEILKLSRDWRITNKKFGQVVEHIKKNAFVDGYNFEWGNDYFYLSPLDTSKTDTVYIEEEDTIYRWFSRYSGLWKETENYTEYKNFKALDSLQKIEDEKQAAQKELHAKYHEVKIEITGYTDDFLLDHGLNVQDPFLKLDYSPIPVSKGYELGRSSGSLSLSSFQTMLKSTDSKYNFSRSMSFYVRKDSLVSVKFGSETRREQGTTQSNGMVSTEYESVYSGLSVSIKDSVYDASYRIDNTELQLVGLTGKQLTASAMVQETKREKLLFIPLRKKKSTTNFNFLMTVTILDDQENNPSGGVSFLTSTP